MSKRIAIEPSSSGWWAESRESSETPTAALGLPGILPRDVAADEILLRRDDLALLVECAPLAQPTLGALAHEFRVAAVVGLPGPALEVEHVIGGAVEEGPVVTHDQHAAGKIAQVSLEPLSGLEVEVVGGLVQEEQVSRCHQLAGETKPAPLAAAQGVDLLSPRPVGIESQALEHRRDPGVDGVAIGALKLFQVPVIALQQFLRCPLAQLSDLCRMGQHLMLQRHQMGVGREGRVPHRLHSGKLPMLIEHRHPKAARAAHGAAGRILFTGDEAEQRGLATPISSHHAPALPLVHYQVQVLEEDVAAVLYGGRRDV